MESSTRLPAEGLLFEADMGPTPMEIHRAQDKCGGVVDEFDPNPPTWPDFGPNSPNLDRLRPGIDQIFVGVYSAHI